MPVVRYRPPEYTDAVSPARFFLLFLSLAAVACHATSAPSTPATTPTTPAAADRQAWLDQFARGYFPGRSGQIFLVPREGDFVVERDPLYAFMHGSPWTYDTHVPLFFHGAPFIKQGVWNDRVTQQDVVPTLAALLGTAPPATALGQPLRQALAATSARAARHRPVRSRRHACGLFRQVR